METVQDENTAGEIQPVSVNPHHVGSGTQRLYRFDNGYGASVVQFMLNGWAGSHGADQGKWELAVIRWNDNGDFKLTYDTPVTEDVIGWLTEDEVQDYLRQIRDLPSVHS